MKKTDISKYWEEWRDAWFVWGMGGEREDGMGGASRIWRDRSNRKGTCMEAAWLVGNQVTLTNSIL